MSSSGNSFSAAKLGGMILCAGTAAVYLTVSRRSNPKSNMQVQLIFGGDGQQGRGPKRDISMVKEVYGAALLPYHFGVPAANVTLYFPDYYRSVGPRRWQKMKEETAEFKDGTVLGFGSFLVRDIDDYHKYFMQILRRAETGHKDIPECDIRVVIGHAFGAAEPGNSYMKCGMPPSEDAGADGSADADDGWAKRSPNCLYFRDLTAPAAGESTVTKGNARVLTILDCCYAPQIVCCLAQKHEAVQQKLPNLSNRKQKRFKRHGLAETWQGLQFPLLCSKNASMRGFKVSLEDKPSSAPADWEPKDDTMSNQVLFSLTNCVILAAKRFADSQNQGQGNSMNDIFDDLYKNLRQEGLGHEWNTDSYCDLSRLEDAIRNGELTVGMPQTSFFGWKQSGSCITYRNPNQWFLDSEYPLTLGSEQWERDIADGLAQFVVQKVSKYHWTNLYEKNLASDASEQAWGNLVRLFGPHYDLLEGVYELGDDGKFHQDLKEEFEHSWDLEYWAVTYPDLPDLVKGIEMKVYGDVVDDSALENLAAMTNSDAQTASNGKVGNGKVGNGKVGNGKE